MEIDETLARRLVDAQFPHWRGLSIRQVFPGGWDNRTFRLGQELLVRLPSADGYAAAVPKEQRWLPVIAPAVPLAVPMPVALGTPTTEFPRPWSEPYWRRVFLVTFRRRQLDTVRPDTSPAYPSP